MTESRIEVVNQLGLHARAAAKLVQLASTFCSRSLLIFEDGEEIDAKSILGILGRGAPQGTSLVVRCEGTDEEAALAAISTLFADRFGEGR
ncbi:MAG: HPr family phosphocarrier protein [Thermoanaerobaculia bacterium]|jgi:phosphotransferase system HPr (HPr) family protein|nr:MAG: HPr family phosphocarrier protein [Thermoanaerobaculia bacterium]MBZ0101545.1 HPr family phosphocarrier protein [Thermoanaerobaculia bacterium]